VKTRAFLAVGLALAGAATLVDAQSKSSSGQPSEQAPFKSGVELVRFDLRVVDSAGRPIADIREDEVEIIENGVKRPIVLFQPITEPAESYVEAATRAVTAEVSSNVAFPRGHLYILIFDQQHITPGHEQKARLAAEQFIRRRVRPSDRVALFAVPGPGPQIGFTADRTRVIKELSKIRGSYERVVATALGSMTAYEAHRLAQGDDKLLVDVFARMNSEAGADVLAIANAGRNTGAAGASADDQSTTRRVIRENARTIVAQSDAESRQFLQRLSDVIAGFREIEGRKTVVLFSEGFFQDNLSRELEAVAAAAAQSYCVFYTFDLNRRGSSVADAYASDTVLASEIQARIAPLGTLAVETDGMMVIDAAGRTDEALNQIADQTQQYYLVGFTPSDEARQNRGAYRRVNVKVTRRGAQVSARTGYALPSDSAAASRRRAIDTVLGAPFVQQGLKVDYTTYVMKAPAIGQHRVILSLTADLPVRSKPGETADVVFVARDTRDGRVVASGTDTIALPAEARKGATLGSGGWRVQFTVPAGSYLMRTVVREPGGLLGSADRRVEVRPLDGPDVTVSDLILGSALSALPVRPRAFKDDGLSGVLEAYGRTSVQLENLEVKLELRRPDETNAVAVFDAELQPAETDDAGLMRRARFAVPLTNVAPGDYVAHAVVRARGEVVAERTRQLEVLDGRGPAATIVAKNGTTSPLEVMRGQLATRYITSLRRRAQGTPIGEAARHAAEGRWEVVEAELQRAGDTAGAASNGLRGLARFVREDFAGAATALKAAFDAEPSDALTAFFLGWACDSSGDSRGALSAWRSAAYLDPTLVSAHLALADGYLRMSERALAVQALRAGLAAIPSSFELQARLNQIEQGR
jgi:VWFA-related protein